MIQIFGARFFQSHEIYEVTLDGSAKRILGNGERGIVDGAGANCGCLFAAESRVIHGRLYVNEYVNDTVFIAAPCDRSRNSS